MTVAAALGAAATKPVFEVISVEWFLCPTAKVESWACNNVTLWRPKGDTKLVADADFSSAWQKPSHWHKRLDNSILLLC